MRLTLHGVILVADSVTMSTAANLAGPSRQGDVLVVPLDSALPAFCVKCGAAAETQLLQQFQWFPVYAYIFLPFGLLYHGVMYPFKRTTNLQVPVCGAHSKRSSTSRLLAGALAVSSFFVGFTIAQFEFRWNYWIAVSACVAMIVAAVVCDSRGSTIIRIVRLDDRAGHYKGVSREFLQHIPGELG